MGMMFASRRAKEDKARKAAAKKAADKAQKPATETKPNGPKQRATE
jgi:hypothetical protein